MFNSCICIVKMCSDSSAAKHSATGGDKRLLHVTVIWHAKITLTAWWLWMRSKSLNLQPFTGYGDVFILVKNLKRDDKHKKIDSTPFILTAHDGFTGQCYFTVIHDVPFWIGICLEQYAVDQFFLMRNSFKGAFMNRL